jgi:hypothetical protein
MRTILQNIIKYLKIFSYTPFQNNANNEDTTKRAEINKCM